MAHILMVLTSHDQLGDTGKKTGFWLAWRPEHMGEALKWWRHRLDRPLLPGILPY